MSYIVFDLTQPFHVVVANDEETKKIQANIATGISQNAAQLMQYLATWDSYREIWELDKTAFIRRYQRLNPPVSSFDADIARLIYILMCAKMPMKIYLFAFRLQHQHNLPYFACKDYFKLVLKLIRFVCQKRMSFN